ncbi:hypothetical protein PPBDW_II1360 [Photobacterium kishitanii]|nr:hypothetical protein PPBDW_II1360 [Photobacterium kishitanii]
MKNYSIHEEAALCSFFYICTPPAHDSPTECDKLSITNKKQFIDLDIYYFHHNL